MRLPGGASFIVAVRSLRYPRVCRRARSRVLPAARRRRARSTRGGSCGGSDTTQASQRTRTTCLQVSPHPHGRTEARRHAPPRGSRASREALSGACDHLNPARAAGPGTPASVLHERSAAALDGGWHAAPGAHRCTGWTGVSVGTDPPTSCPSTSGPFRVDRGDAPWAASG